MKKKRRQSTARPTPWTKIGPVILGLSLAGGIYWAGYWQQPTPAGSYSGSAAASSPGSARAVPPFYENAEAAKPFPRLVPSEYFRNRPLVVRAYRVAAEIPEIVAQQPCYCYCNKFGHRSLLDCYASDHGAG